MCFYSLHPPWWLGGVSYESAKRFAIFHHPKTHKQPIKTPQKTDKDQYINHYTIHKTPQNHLQPPKNSKVCAKQGTFSFVVLLRSSVCLKDPHWNTTDDERRRREKNEQKGFKGSSPTPPGRKNKNKQIKQIKTGKYHWEKHIACFMHICNVRSQVFFPGVWVCLRDFIFYFLFFAALSVSLHCGKTLGPEKSFEYGKKFEEYGWETRTFEEGKKKTPLIQGGGLRQAHTIEKVENPSSRLLKNTSFPHHPPSFSHGDLPGRPRSGSSRASSRRSSRGPRGAALAPLLEPQNGGHGVPMGSPIAQGFNVSQC